MKLPALLSAVKSPATRRGRRLRWICLIILVYTITGFFVLPPIIKSQLLKRLPALTHRQAAVRQVKVNPYALSLTIRGLSLTETNGEPFAGFDEFYVNFQLSSLFRWAWTFSEIRLTHPTASIVRNADGAFNFANLIANEPNPPPQPAKKPGSLPVVLVQHLVVTNGDFNLTDQTRRAPLHLDYSPIDLDLKNFTTRRNKDGLYSLAVTTGAGGSFAWSGTISANPPESAGKFSLRGLVLKTYSPYLADFARAEIADGLLDVGAEYRLNAEPNPIQLNVTNAEVKLANFQLKAAEGGEMLLDLDHVEVSGASVTSAAHEARVARVAVRGGSVLARREHDGLLNWIKLLVTPTNTATAATATQTNAPPAGAAPWKAALDELDVEGLAVTAADEVPPTPSKLGLDNLRLNLKGVSNQTNAPISASIGFQWRGGGTVRVVAKGTLLPPAAEVELAVTNLALPPLQPYLEQQSRLELNRGEFTLNGLARYAPDDPATSLLQFTGDATVSKFASLDMLTYQDFAKWDALDLRGINCTLQTNALSVNEIKFTGLETSLVISSNGQLSALALIKQPPASGPISTNLATLATLTNATPAAEAFPLHIATLAFEKCSFRAADQSLTPHFNTSIEEFNGTVRDLTLPGLTKALVDIRGKVSALSPFAVKGALTPDAENPFVDLTLTLTNNDLTPFTPYAEKFAGHPLNKGKLSFDLSYKIENRKLAATNVVVLDQFTLGPRNDSTNATKLPVKLAVALLKDRNGRIDLDLPVSGSLDDPKFSIGALVWKAISNILLKVATSPFSLLGAMFGGGEELQFVDFPPGSATLEATQTNKLNTLSKALFERPTLNLEISATVDPVTDREKVSRQKLEEKIKSIRLQELTARGKAVPALAEFQIDPADYQRLLRRTYRETFKLEPEQALKQAREAAAATNAAAAGPTALSAAAPLTETVKGATRLIQSAPEAAAVKPVAGAHTSPGATPAKPKTEAELVIDEMEQRLMAAAPATEDDLRDLIHQRCLAVQKFLLDEGKIPSERIFLTAPKPVDPTARTLARATFSLD